MLFQPMSLSRKAQPFSHPDWLCTLSAAALQPPDAFGRNLCRFTMPFLHRRRFLQMPLSVVER